MVCLIFLLTIPQASQATGATGSFEDPNSNFIPQVSIDSTFQKEIPTAPSIAKYIQSIYNYAIGIVGILAAVVLMYGGVIWLTAGGSPDKVNNAKSWIGASLTGLILALCSYMILNTINPDLVNLKDVAPATVEEIKTQTTVYTWEKTDDCNKLERTNYADNYCDEKNKPTEVGHRCCGKLTSSGETQKATSPSEPAYNEDGSPKQFCCQADLDIVWGTDKSVCATFVYSEGNGPKDQFIMSTSVCEKNQLLIDRINQIDGNIRKTSISFIDITNSGGCNPQTGKCVKQ